LPRDFANRSAATAVAGGVASRRIERMRDQLLRSQAEFENFRKRKVKDVQDARFHATCNVIESFLTVYDHFKMAMKSVENGDDLEIVQQGMKMIFSEFGRTVVENGRRGTDHGAAAPVFLAGATCQQPLIGQHPSLTDLDNGALKFHTDFRRVCATVLDGWLGFKSDAILGRHFERLNIFTV